MSLLRSARVVCVTIGKLRAAKHTARPARRRFQLGYGRSAPSDGSVSTRGGYMQPFGCASVGRGSFNLIDHMHGHRSGGGGQPESELFLNRGENRRRGGV